MQFETQTTIFYWYLVKSGMPKSVKTREIPLPTHASTNFSAVLDTELRMLTVRKI